MKTILTLLFLFFALCSFQANAHDTISVNNISKYKIGAKFIGERSGDYSLTPQSYTVFSGGIQVIRQLKNSKSSIESGIYLTSKAVASYAYHELFQNISIPINYRFDTKIIYIAAGPFIDYLVNENFSHGGQHDDNSRKFNVGGNVNLGVEKSINKSLSLMIEARYAITLSSSSTGRRGFFGPSYTNYGFAVGVNYRLPRHS